MYVENYRKILKRCCPDLEKRLAGGAGENQILSFEKVSGIKFPDEYWEMYRHINGESQFTGCFLGFELLSVEAAEGEYKFLLDCPYQVISDKEGVIQEGEYRPGWIPIAHDGSGSFLIMDLNPGPKGTCGQIITLDRDDHVSYLLGNSLENVCGRMEELIKSGVINYKQDDDGYFEWKDGHLFNRLDLYWGSKTEDQWITLDEFGEKRLNSDVKDHKISLKILERYKQLYLMSGCDDGFDSVSLDLLRYMPNLKELVLQLKAEYSLEPLKELSSLKQLVIVFKKLDREQLQLISSLPVKLLRFSKLNISGIDALAESLSLKSLSFYQITGVSGRELGRLDKLNELELDQTPLENYSFLEHMVKLKKLEIRGKKLDHLNFLQNMKGLTELHIEKRADDESGLQYLKNCKRLKVLDYPLSDLRTAALCPAVTSITVDGRDAVHVEALEGSSITSVTMINSDTVLEEIKKYCALRSWGHRGI